MVVVVVVVEALQPGSNIVGCWCTAVAAAAAVAWQLGYCKHYCCTVAVVAVATVVVVGVAEQHVGWADIAVFAPAAERTAVAVAAAAGCIPEVAVAGCTRKAVVGSSYQTFVFNSHKNNSRRGTN